MSTSVRLVEADWLDLSVPDEAAEAEMQAYLTLHPWLKEHYFGKHVAIYHGKLVDANEDFDALFDRINQAYPDQFVWMSEVGDEAIETFTVRSPRFTTSRKLCFFRSIFFDPEFAVIMQQRIDVI